MLSTRTWARLGVAVVAGLLAPAGLDSGQELGASVPRVEPMVAVTGGDIVSSYKLPVAPVPDPPADLMAGADLATREATCPVELRAVVEGPEDAMAVIEVAGESRVVRAGERLRTVQGRIAIGRVMSGAVTVYHGGMTHRCVLSTKVSK